jgi:3-oxoacyl-(acyl-carrier-protein) synthase
VNPAPALHRRLLDRGGHLTVLARAQWPTQPPSALPPIPGFIVSSFSPLAAELAQRCLRQHFGEPPADPERGRRTAIVLASTTGDIVTAAAIASSVDHGRAVPPLLFYQSNPNAVAGHIAARWGLTGPVVCTMPVRDGLADAIGSAALLIEGAEADNALVVLADQGGPDGDRGVAMLVGMSGTS